MDITKKAVVEPPRSTAQPVKAQRSAEHKAQREVAKPGGNQPKASVRVGPTH
jgi:hypothetical protein